MFPVSVVSSHLPPLVVFGTLTLPVSVSAINTLSVRSVPVMFPVSVFIDISFASQASSITLPVDLVEKDPKTESSKRVISISDKLVAVLMEYKEWYDQYKYDVGDRWHETNRLFISEDGKVMYPGTISYWVHKICDQAGLPHRTVHSLRHTNITMQIAAGVPLVTVAGRAGHARTSTTTDIYSHFLKSSDRTAAEKIEELFD